jgi:hypothetical protein
MFFWAPEEAYARLASFIPDDDAAARARGQEAISSGDQEHPQAAHAHTILQVKATIREREYLFLAEFQKLCAASERV